MRVRNSEGDRGRGLTGRRVHDEPTTAPDKSKYTLVNNSRSTDCCQRCDLVEELIEHLRYAGLFLVLLAAGLGVPIPEEVPIVAAGVLSRTAVLRWWISLPVCLVGVLSADAILYWVGHHWGERVLNWRLVRLVLSPAREAQLTQAFQNHGVKIVFTARHVMGLRTAVFLTAGIVRVGFWKFFAIDAAAALLGVPFSFGLAFVFADQVERVFADVHRIERWLALLAVVGIAVGVTIAVRRRSPRP